MGQYAVDIQGLGKRYQLGTRGATRGLHKLFEEKARALGRLILNPGQGLTRPQNDHVLWALRNIDLQIRHGEIVGLTGHNGAGKSVLLKILSRITWPTEGSAVIEGKVGSMLEVGAGFHPEFTGRENLYLIGAILGLKVPEIREKFDQIVDFSEVHDMLDTPVKRYSSGMYVRLAFSVAAHMNANVMLFDEVIAVGDVDFREKCMVRIREMADEGRTIIFVSHNMHTIKDLCPRTLILDAGKLVHDGVTDMALLDKHAHFLPGAAAQEINGKAAEVGGPSDSSTG
jgi:lipopolysaccharide transport system ATP-binding protein